MSAATAGRIGLGLVLASLAATLAVGLAVKTPCASGDWRDGRQYTRYCYSDIVPLLGTEQLHGDRLPYLDACAPSDGNCDEYPVLTMYTMRVAAWITNGISGFFYSNAVLLTVAATAVVVCLYLVAGARALVVALAPTLAMYAYFNWDLLVLALATAGTCAYLKRRDVWSGVFLGLGAAAKLYPALLVVPFVAGRFRGREPDRGIHLAWAAAGSWLAVNLPFMVAAPASWWEFFRFSSSRGVSFDSLWFVACDALTEGGCGDVRTVTLASGVLFVGLTSIVWWAKRARDPGFARWTLGFPILAVFLLSNKVYSPQYSLWLLPWFALALPNLRLFIAFEMSDIAVFLSEFSFFSRMAGTGGVSISTFELAVLLRAAVLTACVVAWVRKREALAEEAPHPVGLAEAPA